MKINSLKYLFPLLLAAGLVGCATNPPVDWNSRVGHYTYADAVHDLGQPDREIHLSNGATEFKWFPRTAQPTAPANSTFAVGGLNNPSPENNPNWNGENRFAAGANTSSVFNRYLELTFDSNGVLTAWSKN